MSIKKNPSRERKKMDWYSFIIFVMLGFGLYPNLIFLTEGFDCEDMLHFICGFIGLLGILLAMVRIF